MKKIISWIIIKSGINGTIEYHFRQYCPATRELVTMNIESLRGLGIFGQRSVTYNPNRDMPNERGKWISMEQMFEGLSLTMGEQSQMRIDLYTVANEVMIKRDSIDINRDTLENIKKAWGNSDMGTLKRQMREILSRVAMVEAGMLTINTNITQLIQQGLTDLNREIINGTATPSPEIEYALKFLQTGIGMLALETNSLQRAEIIKRMKIEISKLFKVEVLTSMREQISKGLIESSEITKKIERLRLAFDENNANVDNGNEYEKTNIEEPRESYTPPE